MVLGPRPVLLCGCGWNDMIGPAIIPCFECECTATWELSGCVLWEVPWYGIRWKQEQAWELLTARVGSSIHFFKILLWIKEGEYQSALFKDKLGNLEGVFLFWSNVIFLNFVSVREWLTWWFRKFKLNMYASYSQPPASISPLQCHLL